MATTKSSASIWSAQTLTAGAGNTTSSSQSVTTGYGAEVYAKLTNGGTGPTIAAQVQVQYSPDNSAWYDGPLLIGSTSSSAVRSWAVEVPIGVAYVRLVAGSNTGQNVTVDAQITNVTAVS